MRRADQAQLEQEIIFRISVIIGILIVSGAIFYHYVIFLPSNKAKVERQAKIQAQLLDNCLDQAYRCYKKEWRSNCHLRDQREDCPLATDIVGILDARLRALKSECYQRYPLQYQ